MKLKKYILTSIFVLLISFFKLENVNAATKFTMCSNLTESSYLRATPNGTPLADVDGQSVFLLTSAKTEILDTTFHNGEKYYKVYANYYSNNYIGWIKSAWVSNCHEYTTDDNYSNALRNKGFPESYILPLSKLHAMYPNWNFIPSNTNLDWNNAINSEYETVSRNLLCSENLSKISPYLSTDGVSYNAGVYKQYEPKCYAASKQTIAFYMDPRNWFNYNTMFMFEQLSYNSTLHTANSVQQILNGTFMSGSYSYNGKNISYANTFVESGRQKNVSPIHLAARVLQEQGKDGSSTINMNGGDGNIYYNHFNINATGPNAQAIINNALTTAKKNGWNNPYLSILGGSGILSNNYISSGQDTIYYQKFNTINKKYWHQYMANVRVAPSESIKAYTAYRDNNILNSSFTFKIPVYSNMPGVTTLSTSNNADNTLKSLSISGCNLNTSFNSSVTNYSCMVPSNTKQVTVNAVKSSVYASIKGDGIVVLNGNSTIASIIVTAANGESKTYKITINKVNPGKESPADIISSIGFNNSNNMISGMALGTNVANIIGNVNNNFKLASIAVKNKKGANKTNGAIATGDKIIVTSNNQTTTFSVVVKGDTSGDGLIDISDLAMIKANMLGKISMTNEILKSADINADGKIDISDLAMVKAHMLGKIKITK